MKRLIGLVVAVLMLLPLASWLDAATSSPGEAYPSPYSLSGRAGVLVIAHGGNNQWDSAVRKAVKKADLDAPTEVWFGMGMHDQEVRRLQQAVDRLERKGIDRLLVVPLFVSSHSEVYRQFEYLFRLRPEGSWPEVGPLNLEVPVVLGRALDQDQAISDILLQRARALSRAPEQETVILVAHGPVTEEDNARWLGDMQAIADRLKAQGGFKHVMTFTMRDDAHKAVQDQAMRQLRAAVQANGEGGRVLVVPVLLARGGVEHKIPKLLNGLQYVFSGETLLPHPKLVEWIAEEATTLAIAPPVEPERSAASESAPAGASSAAPTAVLQ